MWVYRLFRAPEWCFFGDISPWVTSSVMCESWWSAWRFPDFTRWFMYHLVMTNIAMENHHFLIGKPSINGLSWMAHRNRWFTYTKWWFPMAMLDNQRVWDSMIVFYYLLTIHIVHIEYVYQHAYVYIYIHIHMYSLEFVCSSHFMVVRVGSFCSLLPFVYIGPNWFTSNK